MFATGQSDDNCPATEQVGIYTGTEVAASGSRDRKVTINSKVAWTSARLTTIPARGKLHWANRGVEYRPLALAACKLAPCQRALCVSEATWSLADDLHVSSEDE